MNFRNYSSLRAELSPHLNVIVGENAQGKTNVLDAIYLLSFTKSAYTSQDSLNITHGEDMAMVQGVYITSPQPSPQGRELSEQSQFSSLEGRSGGVTYSLVELHLETGRTNQIRVHLASKGCPVVGDRKYGHGNESSPIDRLCLHAKVLAFIHPVTEKTIRFESPVPKEFNRVLV